MPVNESCSSVASMNGQHGYNAQTILFVQAGAFTVVRSLALLS